MLKELNVERARSIAALAEAVRLRRDQLLGNVAEEDLGGIQPGRGEHNPIRRRRLASSLSPQTHGR